MRIRLTGTAEETQAAVTVLADLFEVREVSEFYPNKGTTRLGRIYLDTEPLDIEPSGRAPAAPRPVRRRTGH